MELEFNYNMQLGQQKINREADREKEIENRKDERARIIGTQQSAIANQKQKELDPIDFENPSSIEDLENPIDGLLMDQ